MPARTTLSSSSRTVRVPAACGSPSRAISHSCSHAVTLLSQEEIPPCQQTYHQVRFIYALDIDITLSCNRLNSHLSVRIEELNAQISDLHVENLRLRASEIALSAQLKKEREKSRRVLADAEAAVSVPAADQNVLLIVSLPQVHSFMKQLGHIRKFINVPHSLPISP